MRTPVSILSALGIVALVGCDQPPPPPPPDPPRVTITPIASSVADRVLPVSLTVHGCDEITALTIYDGEEIAQQVVWAGNPTRVELEPKQLDFSSGIAAHLSLTAKVTCADGRTNTSHAAPVTFFPAAGVVRHPEGGPLVTDVFVAEGTEPNVTFLGCSGNGNGTTSLVRVDQTGTIVAWNSSLPFSCSNNLWITDVNAATGKRWAVEPGLGAFAFDPSLNITAYYLGSVQNLGVGPDGDAVLYDNQDADWPVQRIAHATGAKVWGFSSKGKLMGNPSVQNLGVYLPVFADPFGQYQATVAVQRVDYSNGLLVGENAIKQITYGLGDVPPVPPVHFNVDATVMYFPFQPQVGSSIILACATNQNGCSGPAALKWQSPTLIGNVVLTMPFASGSVIAAIAHQHTWFLDATNGRVINRDGAAIHPHGALVTMAVQPGKGRDFYLLNGSGQPGSLPLEVVAIDAPEYGELWRYEIAGASMMLGIDASGQSWLRVGQELVKPHPISEYQLIRAALDRTHGNTGTCVPIFHRTAARSASRLPAGPGTCESTIPVTCRPASSTKRRMRSMASVRTAGSRTTPPLPTFSRPTSNWGFTSATSTPPGFSFGRTDGSTWVSEMKLTSITTMSTGSGRSSSVR